MFIFLTILLLYFSDPESVFKNYDFTPKVKQAIIDVLAVKMVARPVKIKAEFVITCYTLGGVEDIKDSLRKGVAIATSDIPIEIKLIASPLYHITTTTIKKNEGLNLLNEALKKIEAAVKARSGNFVLNSKVSTYY